MIKKWAGIFGIAGMLLALPVQTLAASSAVTNQEVYTLAKVPGKPQLRSVTADQVNLSIASNNPSGTVIRLYGSDDNQQWTLLEQDADLSTYSDTSVIEGQTRFYKVTAVNGDGVETKASPVLQVLVSDPIDLQDVTLSLVQGKAKFSGLPTLKPSWKYVATLNQSGGKLIGTSPRFMKISDLEEWITYHLQFSQTYEVIFGIQIGDDDTTRVTKSFVLITDPDPKVEFEKKFNHVVTNLIYTVDGDKETKEAWVDVSIPSLPEGISVKGTMNGQTQLLSSSPVRFSGLEEKAIYKLLVTVTDGSMVKTQEYEIQTPDLSEAEQVFNEKAKAIVGTTSIKMDGAPNSGIVWVEVTVPQSKYQVKVSLDGKAFTGTNPYRMDNLPDNTNFVLLFEITDGTHVYKQQVPITTPNRTAPNVKSAYVEQNNIILIIESKSELKQD
ncbi:hypothetical protein QO009_004122 [Brevibacillus aydinogluensis]|jgi:hypothetical protein|uniref:hypothetical protein n=1 Tax=Brevibacillus aydinogluensis TaxID=927786 RepID=UPI0028933EF6|nr:hypothetical protein [Brevibacillus aydinogluensis]MDT3418197.1 hypothetical protein [Brevibacillus aydinogluensis]